MFGKSFNQSTHALLATGALVLLTLGSSFAVIAQPRTPSYGLGMPRTAGTGGATRGNLPQVVMLAPDDGARTLSDRPSFYWYVEKAPFRTTFFLRDSVDGRSKTVYKLEGKADKPGLYRITLPDNIRLKNNDPQRWQVRWQDEKGVEQVDVASAIKLEPNPQLSAQLASAKTELERARIYSANFYWYDAFDSYTKWLEANPQDQKAIQERNTLIKAGFQSSDKITPAVMERFLARINGNTVKTIATVSPAIN